MAFSQRTLHRPLAAAKAFTVFGFWHLLDSLERAVVELHRRALS